MREKIDAVFFGWFIPVFFVGAGIKFDLSALLRDLTTMLLVPALLVLFLPARGVPVVLYRNDITRQQWLPFALFNAVASLSLIVVIIEIGARRHIMSPDIAASLVGAAVLSVLLFPTIARALCSKAARNSLPRGLGMTN